MALALGLVLHLSPAQANDEDFELWFNPSIGSEIDDDTGWELETAQRLRDESEGRVDTYFARLWLNQSLSSQLTFNGGVERRRNVGGTDETRLLQQLSGKHGLLRTRLRLEQRFVDDADRMGLRLRPRLGVAVPVGEDGRWTFKSDAELFLTLVSTRRGGDEGLTGLRTQVGFGYQFSSNLDLSLAYLRQQDFEEGGPDEIGHAPIVGIEYAF